jgi:phage tail-like protein
VARLGDEQGQLAVPHSLLDGLPALYRDDDFLTRWIDALDQVLAPVHATVDNLDAYLDPALTPEDFLPWLASWVGVAVDEQWPARRRRELVTAAVELYRWRGTARGIASAVALYTGTVPEIIESGGAAFATGPAPYPGSPRLGLLVRLRTDGQPIDRAAVDAIVTESKPAHVPHRVEIIDVAS